MSMYFSYKNYVSLGAGLRIMPKISLGSSSCRLYSHVLGPRALDREGSSRIPNLRRFSPITAGREAAD